MTTAFNRYASRGNEFISQLAEELNMPYDKPRAYRILKAVLSSIRNHITPEESTQLIAQLPMALKSIYVDGWQIGKKNKRVDTIKEFIDEVYYNSGGYRGRAFNNRIEVEAGIKAVLNVLKKYISEGEFEDVLMCLPSPLRVEILDYVMEGKGLIL
jgi:uncharacterized protein (DUF2267 family)